ncbi:MAG: hypothetical protein LUC38_10060 [Oscillospiraceae bacterium]|nr:hypothetical protein [Oscillospiraceae bacterium]
MKKILAYTLALAMLLSLVGCGSQENEPEVTTGATVISGDAEVVTSVTTEAAESTENITTVVVSGTTVEKVDIVAVFEGAYSYTERSFDTRSYESNGGTGYTLENDQYVDIYEYDSEEDAVQAASQFDSSGTTFYGSDDTVTEYEYVYPVHFWLNGSNIIFYCSETGEFLQDFNSILGTEFAGAGSDYFRPAYANDLIYALWDAGYSVEYKYSSGTGQDYLKDTETACLLVVSNGEVISLWEYPDEYEALDEAARYSVLGDFYAGESTTISIAYAAPTHFYLKDNVIVRYSSDSGELLDAISSVYGYQFAGEEYDYDGEKPWYTTGSVYFDYITAPAENGGSISAFPQYAVIRSTEELESIQDELDLSIPLYVDTTWEMMTYRYSDEWFKTNDLILVLLEEPSGSINPYVTDVTRDEDRDYTIYINDDRPEVATDDMAYWYIFVELTGTKINSMTQVEVVSSR